ncbi:MAG: Ig domain-containing protein, partial [Candidatus Binatia bacterium]
ISGTPAGPDVKQFIVRAREPFRRFGERTLTLTVAAALQASSAVRAGEVGVRYTGAIRGAGGVRPLTWSVASGTLPAGLSLSTTTGAIGGVPRAAGRFALTFAVTDSAGQRVTVPASIRIAARLAITSTRLPQATEGEAYRAQLVARGGLGPKQWRVVRGKLPRGLRLDQTTGTLRGTPREAGTYRITVQATDRLGGKSTKTFRLTVLG